MHIRWYEPEDEPYLMELERLSPRGEPRPFVHFRRRFIDRAAMYDNYYLFVAEEDHRPIGVTSITIKDTWIGNEPVRIAYSFDTRVHPNYRRIGVANAMQEAKLNFLFQEGIHGMYAYVVATNYPALNMLEKIGHHRARLVLHLTYSPYPLIIPPVQAPHFLNGISDSGIVDAVYSSRDMYVQDVDVAVSEFNFERLFYDYGGPNFAGLSIFDQSLVYQQISADEPWPTEEEVMKRARTLRLFDPTGLHNGTSLRNIFDYVRDLAVTSNVAKLSMILDRNDTVPGFFFQEATNQTDYWLMFRPLIPDWEPQWNGGPIYIDPRDF